MNELPFEKGLSEREILIFVGDFIKRKGFTLANVNRAMKAYYEHNPNAKGEYVNENKMQRFRNGSNTNVYRWHWTSLIEASHWWEQNRDKLTNIKRTIPKDVNVDIDELTAYIEAEKAKPTTHEVERSTAPIEEITIFKKDLELMHSKIDGLEKQADLQSTLIKMVIEDNKKLTRLTIELAEEVNNHRSVLTDSNRGD